MFENGLIRRVFSTSAKISVLAEKSNTSSAPIIRFLTRVYRDVLVTRVYRQLHKCVAVWAASITQERHYIFL